jgi:hypothetical protein
VKKLHLIILFLLTFPALADAAETKILFYQYKIPGPQISKDYYIKESLKKVDPANPRVLQVRTYSRVTSPEGTTEYRTTYQINCQTMELLIIKNWSTGFGEEDVSDRKWTPVSEYKSSSALANKICK